MIWSIVADDEEGTEGKIRDSRCCIDLNINEFEIC